MCPALNGKRCKDSEGVVYGVLCDTRATGQVITNSGKKEKRDEDLGDEGLEERDFSGK